MIESIIKRFQDAGFKVNVRHSKIMDLGILTIYKRIGQEEIIMDWAIPREELNMPAPVLFNWADQHIHALNQAIAEKQRGLA